MNVTRDVISDLWPLYEEGEVSPATVRVVEDFLASDPEFARELEESRGVRLPDAAPGPDHEVETLRRVKRRLDGDHWLFHLASVFTAFAGVRFVTDTTFTAPPHRFFVTLTLAAVCWIAFGVTLYRARRRFLLVKLR
jgi:hypothetical protein